MAPALLLLLSPTRTHINNHSCFSATIAGTNALITFTTPFTFTFITFSNSSAVTFQSGAFLLTIDALFINKSGALFL